MKIESRIPVTHQAAIDRFVAFARTDERVAAAFLGGSYARDAADEYSDLDLYLIATDEGYPSLRAEFDSVIAVLGEPLFRESFNLPHWLFFILPDGTEGEIGLGRASAFRQIHTGPYRVLLDKQGLLAGATFPAREADARAQAVRLRELIYWFWHDLSHLITALGRDQLWWAGGQLEELRRYAVNLARLDNNWPDPGVGDEPYFKLERAVPPERLSPLRASFCPLERAAILEAARVILRYYQAVAPVLAAQHGIIYPSQLEQIMVGRLERLTDGTRSAGPSPNET